MFKSAAPPSPLPGEELLMRLERSHVRGEQDQRPPHLPAAEHTHTYTPNLWSSAAPTVFAMYK